MFDHFRNRCWKERREVHLFKSQIYCLQTGLCSFNGEAPFKIVGNGNSVQYLLFVKSTKDFRSFLEIWLHWSGSRNTLTRKNMNLPYFIRMYWTNFWQPTVHVQQNVYEKTLIEVGSFFWHLFRSNWTIFGGTVSLWKMFENGKIAVFLGKWRKFRILLKV